MKEQIEQVEINDIFSDEDEEGRKKFEENVVRDVTGCFIVIGIIVLSLVGWGIYEIIN